MKKLLVAAILLLSCDPNFADCPNCKVDEDSAESVDGTEQIPIVVVVNVNVDVDQSQNQGQGQVQGQGQDQTNTNNNTNTNTNTNNSGTGGGTGTVLVVDAGTSPVTVKDAGVPDAGTPPKHDAGTPDAGKPDAGTPSKPDAGTCHKVCTCYEVHYVCKTSNKDTTKKSDCTCGVLKTYNKCTKEETKCQ